MNRITPYKKNSLLSLLNRDFMQPLQLFGDNEHLSQIFSGKHMPTDILEKEDIFEVKMDAPGYDSRDIDIHIDENNVLTVTGKHQTKSENVKALNSFAEKSRYLM